MNIDFEALKMQPEDSMYCAGWNEAIEKVQAMLAEQKPFGWFYELPSGIEAETETSGKIYLGCTGPDAENVTRQAREATDGPAFPLYAGKEGVPLSELQAAVKAGLEDNEITGAA